MGKEKQTQKHPEPNPTSSDQRGDPKNQLLSASVFQPGVLISTNALAEILRVTNPGVDWPTLFAAIGQIMGTVTAASVTLAVTAPQPRVPSITVLQTAFQIPTETSPQKSMLTETPIPTPNPTPTEPLDVSPISMYRSSGSEEKGREEEEAMIEEMTT